MLTTPRTCAWIVSTDHDGGILGPLEKRHKDERQDVYGFMRLSRICARCHLLKGELKLKCRHHAHWTPYFKPAAKEKQVQILYSAVGDEDAYKTELMAYNENYQTCFFEREAIINCMKIVERKDQRFYVGEARGLHIPDTEDLHIGIDPSGGGLSYLAIFVTSFNTMTRLRPVHYICLYDVHEDANGLNDMAVTHMFEYLDKKFPKNRKYIACENKPLPTMACIANIARLYPNTYFFQAGNMNTNNGLGVNPTKDMKAAMFGHLARCMDVIFLSPDLECHSNIGLNYQGFKMPDVKSLVIAIMKDNLFNVNMNEKQAISGKGCRGIPVLDNDDGAMAMGYSLYCELLKTRHGIQTQTTIDDVLTIHHIHEQQKLRNFAAKNNRTT